MSTPDPRPGAQLADRRMDVLYAAAAATFAMVGLAAILLAQPGVLGRGHAWAAYLLLVALLAAIGWGGWGWLRREQGEMAATWLHPPVLLTGYMVLLVALPGLFLFWFPEFFGILSELRHDYFAWGMALMFAGMVSLWTGYLATWKLSRPLGILRDLGSLPIHLPVALGLYALTLLTRIYRIRVAGVAYGAHVTGAGIGSGLDQWLSYLESARYLVLVIVAIHVFRRAWPRSVLIAILAIEVVYAFTSGFTKPMFWISVVTLVAAAASGVRLRQYTRYLMVLGLLGVLIIPVSQGLRASIQQYGFDTRSPGAAVRSTVHVLETTWGAGAGVGWQMFLEKVPGRFAFVAYMPGLMMSRTPSYIPHLGFDAFVEVPLYILPRAIWRDKPVYSRGRWFSVNYLDMPVDTNSSTAITVFGESYLFAGWSTMLIALFSLGVMLALIYRNTAGAGLGALFIAMLPGILDIEMEFTGKFVALFQGTIFVLVVYAALAAVSWMLGARATEPAVPDTGGRRPEPSGHARLPAATRP